MSGYVKPENLWTFCKILQWEHDVLVFKMQDLQSP